MFHMINYLLEKGSLMGTKSLKSKVLLFRSGAVKNAVFALDWVLYLCRELCSKFIQTKRNTNTKYFPKDMPTFSSFFLLLFIFKIQWPYENVTSLTKLISYILWYFFLLHHYFLCPLLMVFLGRRCIELDDTKDCYIEYSCGIFSGVSR